MSNTVLIIIALLALAVTAWLLLRRTSGQRTASANAVADSTANNEDNLAPLPIGTRRVITETEHQIPRRKLDDNAMKVVYRLEDAGHEG